MRADCGYRAVDLPGTGRRLHRVRDLGSLPETQSECSSFTPRMAHNGVFPGIANHRSRMSRYGAGARTPWVGLVLTSPCKHLSTKWLGPMIRATGWRGSIMKNEVDDIPMVYLLYVLLAIAAAVVAAAALVMLLF
jgi:hypothetical protein